MFSEWARAEKLPPAVTGTLALVSRCWTTKAPFRRESLDEGAFRGDLAGNPLVAA